MFNKSYCLAIVVALTGCSIEAAGKGPLGTNETPIGNGADAGGTGTISGDAAVEDASLPDGGEIPRDLCPGDVNKLSPGQCGCGIPDRDDDGNGRADCLTECDGGIADGGGCACSGDECVEDQCPNSMKTEPGLCGCDQADTDTDGDGAADCMDLCAMDPNKLIPGACGCGALDVDSDRDGTPNCSDECPRDRAKVLPGQCGCGESEVDGDHDGTPDCIDPCAKDPGKTQPGTCGCGRADVDGDGDGTLDCLDGCSADPDKTSPGQCGCGQTEDDHDGDMSADCVDQCDDDPSKQAPGTCGCGTPDSDLNGNATPDCQDACPPDAPASTCNVLPVVTFAFPTSPDVPFQELGVEVSATDADGTILHVKLLIDGREYHQENMAPYQWGTLHPSQTTELRKLTRGNHQLMAIARDNLGGTSQVTMDIVITGE